MDRLLRWTILQIAIFSTLKVRNSSCQHTQQATALSSLPVHQEFAKDSPNNPSPTPQLMNTLLTIAAANGVLPELFPKIQPMHQAPYPQEVDHKNLAVPVQQPTLRHDQIPQMVSTELQGIPIHATAGYGTTAKPMPIVPPIVISPGPNTQPINPFPNLELQHPRSNQPKQECSLCSDHMATTSHISPNPPSLPMININTIDTSRLNVEPLCANSILTTENGVQYPVNLQISIPPPNVEAPRITFINAGLPTTGSQTSTEVNSGYNNWFPCGYPQPQQVIVKKRKSPLKDWLPLIIYSMLHKDRGCRNYGCCCPCKSRGGTVPIPYPIPIPTNSPIIGTGFSFHNTSLNSTKSDHHCNRHHHD